MFWAVLVGFAWADDDALTVARAELAALVEMTDDEELKAALARIDAKLQEADEPSEALVKMEEEAPAEPRPALEVEPEPVLGSAVEPEPVLGSAVEPEPALGSAVEPESALGSAVEPESALEEETEFLVSGVVCTVGEYEDLRTTVEEESFSRDKIAVLEKASDRLSFSVEQVMGLLGGLDFGSDRVRVAALLHPRLVDPDDFGRVYDLLDFEADREELRVLIDEPSGD